MQDKIIRYLPELDNLTGEVSDLYGTVIDVETTSVEEDAEITEFTAIRFYFDIEGKITAYEPAKTYYNEPSQPLSQEVIDYTGITDEMLKGHHLSTEQIVDALGDSAIVICHNAKFDRTIIEKYHKIPDYFWACSLNDIDWKKKNFSARTLDYLAYRYGFYFNPHRAEEDARALLNILSYDDNLRHIMDVTFTPQFIVHFVNTSFADKEIFKKAGCKWDGQVKAWYHIVEEDALIELEQMFEGLSGQMMVDELNPVDRYR